MSASQAKADARAEARVRRAGAYEAYQGLGGGLFVQPFIRAIFPAPGSIVAAYVAIGDEADPSVLLEVLVREGGCRLALPRIEAADRPLSFRVWTPGEALLPGPFGTQEPLGEAAEAQPDLVIVPLLAFSCDGHRLGYGGGYYDRTLATLRRQKPDVLAVGLAFAAQEVTHLPIGPEDQPLDWIVTEREARAFSGRTT